MVVIEVIIFAMKKYYAVVKGVCTGIFQDWKVVRKLVLNYKGAVYKGYNRRQDAEAFLQNPTATTTKKLETLSISNTMEIADVSCLKHYNVIYTDGSVKRNQKGVAAGYGVFIGKDATNYSIPWFQCQLSNKSPTNMLLETLALLHALQVIEKYFERHALKPITVKSDCLNAIESLGTHYPKWVKNGWKTIRGHPPAHAELLQKCKRILSRYEMINLAYVPGHQGDYGNEVAHWLATRAAKEYTSHHNTTQQNTTE